MNHWDNFVNIIRIEVDSRGPDPFLLMLAELSKGQDDISKVWLAGCYGAHGTVPSAYATWKSWPDPATVVDAYQTGDLIGWLNRHWTGLPVRGEFRSHRMVEKRAVCLRDFALYALQESWVGKDYDFLWDDSRARVKYYGRYAAIKYIELLRMMLENEALTSYDLRAKHAWSPRKTLSLLFPEHRAILDDRSNNSEEAVQLAEYYATYTKNWLAQQGVDLSYFQLQVLLCNYRECLSGTHYPSKSHDEEIPFIRAAEEFFGEEVLAPVWQVRKDLFKPEYLGEIGGWDSVRRDKLVWKAPH